MDWIIIYREDDTLCLEMITNDELADDSRFDDKLVVLLVRNDTEGVVAMHAAETVIGFNTINPEPENCEDVKA